MNQETLDWGAYTAGQLVDPTLYNIRRERRCELMAEGLRWMDLKRWRAMTNGAPDYKVNETFYTYLDKAISWAEELKLYIIIDNHTFYSDGSVYNTIEPQLTKIWNQVSKRYNTRSKFVMYEICNEPHGRVCLGSD